MVFSSTIFLLIFLPILLGLYYMTPRKYKNQVLLGGSLVFYGFGEPKYLIVMVGSIVFNYMMGVALGKYKEKGLLNKSKALLILNLIANLVLLTSFKYGNHFAQWVLPIGISFYTFQEISYIIDVYNGKVLYQRNILKYATYVALFPQLIAGPIVRYSDVEVALSSRKENLEQFSEGVRRFIIGLGKKVILANQLGPIFLEVQKMNIDNLALVSAWIGAIAFTLQIYFDFSGYSDMAIGLGKMFGFDFLENFNYPYKSKSITEFWRRWHISLGSWFREYLYIPLGGNRKGLKHQVVNLIIVWSLTGMWHGASGNFLVWGLYFGIILIIEKLWLLPLLSKAGSIVSRIYALFFIVLGWVIFANTDFDVMLGYIRAMFFLNGNFFDAGSKFLLADGGLLLLGGAFISVGVIKKTLESKKAGVTILYMGILLCSMAFLVSSAYNPFLYFRF